MLKKILFVLIGICALVKCEAQAIFDVDFSSAINVKNAKGILAEEVKFEQGLVCKTAKKGINFCRFPRFDSLNPQQGTIELEFKQSWNQSVSHTNCLFNTGLGIWWCSPNSFHIQREGKRLKFMIVDSKKKIHIVTVHNFPSKYNDNEYHKISATWNSELGLVIYVDGIKEGFTRCKFKLNNMKQTLYVGNDGIAKGGQKFYYPAEATIKSLKIYDKAKTEFIPLEPIKAVLYPAVNNNWETTFLPGVPVHLLFFYYGKRQGINKAELQIELPEKLRLIGLCQTKINNIYPEKPVFTCKKVVRNGIKYHKYDIEIMDIKRLSSSLTGAYNHAIYVEPEKDIKPGDYEIFWKINVNGKQGKECLLKTTVLPRLQYKKMPEDFMVSLFFGGSLTSPAMGGHLMIHPDDQKTVGEKIRAYCRDYKVNYGYRPEPSNKSSFIAMHAGWLNYGGWGESKKLGHHRIDRNGKKLGSFACPSYIARDAINFSKDLIEKLRQTYSSYQTQFVMPDYELQRAQIECFCPECVTAFKKYADIKKGIELSPEIILTKYGEKWSNFLCQQNAMVLKQVTNVIREARPQAKIYLCANHVFDKDYKDKVTHDVKLFEPYVDAHMPMIYYSGMDYYRKIEKTCKSLKKKVIPHICVNDVVYMSPIHMSAKAMRMNILATFASGGKGCAFYPGLSSFDGEYYATLAETLAEIAQVEQYFKRFKRNDKAAKLSSKYELPVKVFENNGDKLICIFNYNKSKAYYKISSENYSGKNFQACDLLKKTKLGGKTTEGKFSSYGSIAPLDVSFIIVTADEEQFKLFKSNDLKGTKQGFLKKLELPAAIKDTKNISCDGELIKISVPSQSIWLNVQSGGRLWQWEINGISYVNNQDIATGGMFQDLFFPRPGWGGEQTASYQVSKQFSDKEKVAITFSKNLQKPQGILLEKTFVVDKNIPGFTVHYAYRNLGDTNVELTPWIHNVPFPKSKKWDLLLQGSGKIENIKFDSSRVNNIYFVHGNSPKSRWEKGAFVKYFYPGPVRLKPNGQSEMIEYSFDFNKLKYLYVWNGGDNTLEFFYKTISLASQEQWTTDIEVSLKK